MKSSQPATISSVNDQLRQVIKRRHYPLEIMLTCVRWYVAYPLSLRQKVDQLGLASLLRQNLNT